MDDGGSDAELVTLFYFFSQLSVIFLHWQVRYLSIKDLIISSVREVLSVPLQS